MTTGHARLTGALRELRTRTGLSMASLAGRTGYSKSSWERYLNGKSLPPRQAVRDLCRIADEPDGRLSALWEIAESEWKGRAAVRAADTGKTRPRPPSPESPGPRHPPEQTEPTGSTDPGAPWKSTEQTGPTDRPEPQAPPKSGRPHRRGRRLMLVLPSAYTVVAGGVALALFLLSVPDPGRDGPRSASLPYSRVPPCHGADCEGRDPMRLTCAIGPGTLAAYRTTTGAHVEIRHSEKCAASWARTWGTRIGDRLELTVNGPVHIARIARQDDTETYVYTAMAAVRPGSTIRACFRPAAADGERECVEARVDVASATTRALPSPG
ncbi:helix-turn-helix domain-containing protein [Streptomyces sp. NPDC085944]|uniref:helix-turn-helix domain-containing protein n=1 Tax=Streptomyces sp. NPDC085944 TaxID=3154962 RepID=UPI003414EBAC